MPINIERVESLLNAAKEYQNIYNNIRRYTGADFANTMRDMYAALDSDEKREIARPFYEYYLNNVVSWIAHDMEPSRTAEMVLMEETLVQKHNKPQNRRMKLVMQQRRNKAKYGE